MRLLSKTGVRYGRGLSSRDSKSVLLRRHAAYMRDAQLRTGCAGCKVFWGLACVSEPSQVLGNSIRYCAMCGCSHTADCCWGHIALVGHACKYGSTIYTAMRNPSSGLIFVRAALFSGSLSAFLQSIVGYLLFLCDGEQQRWSKCTGVG